MSETTEAPTTTEVPAPPAVPAAPPPAATDRPDWLPEKFADGAALAKSYAELEAWKGTKTEALRAEVLAALREGVPEQADAYDFTVPDGLLPEGFKAEIPKDDPFLNQMKGVFHQLGAKPEQFQAAAEAFLRWQVANMPDVMAERAKLGEGAPERIAAVDAWLAKTLPDGEYHALSASIMSAEGIAAIERLMKLATGGAPQGVPGGGPGGVPSVEDAQAILQNPAYRTDTPEGAKLRARFAAFVQAGGRLPGYSR